MLAYGRWTQAQVDQNNLPWTNVATWCYTWIGLGMGWMDGCPGGEVLS